MAAPGDRESRRRWSTGLDGSDVLGFILGEEQSYILEVQQVFEVAVSPQKLSSTFAAQFLLRILV